LKKLAIIQGSEIDGLPQKRRAGNEGGIAQLGERLHGMQEVIGSIPFTSTTEVSTGFDPIV
jgi:hypothetical protein